jgi:hypothetical protein
MDARVEIRDGVSHWWHSPDIWVVPGSDPNGPPGQPIAGQFNYLSGRVRNTGNAAVSGVNVKFYWSNPAMGVLRSNSTLVGNAFVDLNPGESKDVLCIVPWVPEIFNDGHECVVAEAIDPNDPLSGRSGIRKPVGGILSERLSSDGRIDSRTAGPNNATMESTNEKIT